ncbi:MAG TPA: DUF2383 domain-containing protein [Tepidisphaeraceae bacterium]|nr:DUF2383 domain-containing protein [Tepidisphaeraceae bacterium]
MSDGTASNPALNADSREKGTEGIITQLNSLLRGEISAAETYKQAIDKVGTDHAESVKMLRQIQDEHGRAAQGIRERIRSMGGEAADSSGAWGIWAKTVQGTMSLFGGDTGALKALKEGEEHGLKDYREAIDDVDGATAQMITNQFIPAQQRHINLLDQLMTSTAKA